MDYYQQDEGFDLKLFDQLRVRSSAASDVALRTLGACLLGALAYPPGYNPLQIKRALEDRALYGTLAERHDATAFFHRPPRCVPVRRKRARRPLFLPQDGRCEDLSFESPFVPVNPRLRSEYLSHAGNKHAHARYWSHNDGPRPTIIAVHGFSADLYHLNEWFFALPSFYEMGCDVLLFTMPFHGKRQTRFSPFSGHGFFAGGVSRINEAFAQAVHDLRIFVDWLLDQVHAPQVGMTGVSLGGFTTALMASVEPRLAFALPNVPVISLADTLMEWEPLASMIRASLKLFGRSLVDARHLLAVSTPLTYEPALAKERLMIIGGIGDRLAPPKQSKLLWEHWGRCRIHWFPGSHLIHLDRGAYIKQIELFLDSLEFLPRRGDHKQL